MAIRSLATCEARRQWNNIFNILRLNNCQLRILYPQKLYFKNENEVENCFRLKLKGL